MSCFARIVRGLTAAVLTAVGVAPAAAQAPSADPPSLPDVNDFLKQHQLTPAGFGRQATSPCTLGCPPAQCWPCPGYTPGCPGVPCTPSPVPGTVPPGTYNPPTGTGSELSSTAPTSETPDFGARGRGAGAGPSVGLGGYIDNAAPVTMFRMRFDAGYGDNRPDRAEFFYAKCSCFRAINPPQLDAHGPPLPEKNVDYQELTPYLEYAINPRFSVYADIPIRFINPTVNANAAGLSDVSFGAKYAFIYNERRIVSFSLRAIAPSGSQATGLGTGNWWLEPALLWLEQLNPKWQVFGEFHDQFSLGARSDFTGNITRYGLGTSYIVASGRYGYVAPVVECVGWTVLSGKELDLDFGNSVSAAGDTIVNAKIGFRIGFGSVNAGQPYPTRSDLYVGYGRALTGEVWYKDLLRVEFRYFF